MLEFKLNLSLCSTKNLLKYSLFVGLYFTILSCSPENDKIETLFGEESNSSKNGTLTYNGYTYKTVVIGDQEWLAENLRTTTYNDGTSIVNITDNTAWAGSNNGAICAFNNDQNNSSIYGYLYNWNAVNTGKLAPAGWRVPNDNDWTRLTDYVGGESTAGKTLKAKTGWIAGALGDDNYGFSALPGGYRSATGSFDNVGYYGYWWSSSPTVANGAWIRQMGLDRSVYRYDKSSRNGFSVRFVRTIGTQVNNPPMAPSNPSPASNLTTLMPTTVSLSWSCSDPDGDAVTYDVYFGTNSSPTTIVSANQTTKTFKPSILTTNTIYYWKIVAKDSRGGSTTGAVWQFKTISGYDFTFDGHLYKTVVIGTQVWTVENLQTTKYNDGSAITKIPDSANWATASSGAFCAHGNNEINVVTYGYLYNWFAVNTGKLAPPGWRVPTDADWTKLTDYLGGVTTAGTKLKARSGWNSSGNGTDDYGFSALPGGFRIYGGDFYSLGYYGAWWSSSDFDSERSIYRELGFDGAHVNKDSYYFGGAFSIRLVRDVQ
ncbi:MAG: hypothetical protein LCH54_13750 [Bacteroidetes bacterium]|nr:hypothetical protein [Bacteroidota bacterium]